ncbi:transcription termination/antitermination protein NusG [Alcaligenes endophyticus]|uniref:Transcriptional activator RfaH n=1 Tax=Alcaligenes endophyticus TaxID=1929088 RepID=A0ABT8EFU9_9BURK|nr:transcription termination/antitermination NusG family protein [Alcaligenes endophyticus]MCX5590199.1 transcriptional activator RfaH [Alcaligenes endophyticus]MDN4120138.1 transcriptional activator RfaH [Alcaligenes endophyticus]
MEHCFAHWYLAYTKPRQEQVAAYNLQQQQFQVYLPLYKTRQRKTEGGYTEAHPPMFPRYLFFKPTRAEQSLAVIRSTKGISNLVQTTTQVATVNNAIIDDIRQAEALRHQLDLSLSPRLRAGTKVRISSGSFQGLEGLVESSTNKRLMLLLDILGQHTKVRLNASEVEPLE